MNDEAAVRANVSERRSHSRHGPRESRCDTQGHARRLGSPIFVARQPEHHGRQLPVGRSSETIYLINHDHRPVAPTDAMTLSGGVCTQRIFLMASASDISAPVPRGQLRDPVLEEIEPDRVAELRRLGQLRSHALDYRHVDSFPCHAIMSRFTAPCEARIGRP